MTNFEKIMQGGAEALADIFICSLSVQIRSDLCQNNSCRQKDGDCRKCFLDYLNSPAEPAKPNLTEDEEIFVRWAVIFDIKWIARNGDGLLFAYIEKPYKLGNAWLSFEDYCAHVDSAKYPFSFIQWNDTEPVYLPDLLGECE